MLGPIGVDLDNTIVGYNKILYKLAIKYDLIEPSIEMDKNVIRDSIRKRPNGEIEWQKAQAEIYGPKINEAELIEGVENFFLLCRENNIEVFIVSHKTEFANYDTTSTNLRYAALKWLDNNKFFDLDGIGLKSEDVYFGSTRNEKINIIRELCCTIFIDDLEETFMEETFPNEISKVLYDPHHQYRSRDGVFICHSWQEIIEKIFHDIQ